MIHQQIYLPSVHWKIHIFYDVAPDDVYEVRALMAYLGASRKVMDDAEDNIVNGGYNCGLTWTNEKCDTTVMVIGQTTSPRQFWDTFDHEKGHAVTHIAECMGLPEEGEAKQYLSGEIANKTFPIAMRFVCGGCMR